MKKKILFGGIAVLVIAAVAAWNVSLNSQKSELSDTMLANVEALAQSEGDPVYIPCCLMLNSTCNFSVINGNGQSGIMSVYDHYRCR
jgi:hypothetical protein